MFIVVHSNCPCSMWSRVYETRESVRPSVCPSVPSCSHCTPLHRVCCCLPSRQKMWINCYMTGGQPQARHSTAHSSKCGQFLVVSWRRKLNTDLFLVCFRIDVFFAVFLDILPFCWAYVAAVEYIIGLFSLLLMSSVLFCHSSLLTL